jgi:hypothetical protein
MGSPFRFPPTVLPFAKQHENTRATGAFVHRVLDSRLGGKLSVRARTSGGSARGKVAETMARMPTSGNSADEKVQGVEAAAMAPAWPMAWPTLPADMQRQR